MIRPVRLRLLIISLLLGRREEGLTGRTNLNRLCKLSSIPLVTLSYVPVQTLLHSIKTKPQQFRGQFKLTRIEAFFDMIFQISWQPARG